MVVARVDGLAPDELRELALAVRNAAASTAWCSIGVTPTGGVSLVARGPARPRHAGVGAASRDAAKAVGGGGGGKGDVATAGGKDAVGTRRRRSRLARDAVALADRQLVRVPRARPRVEAHRRRRQRSHRARWRRRSTCSNAPGRGAHDHRRIAELVRDEEAELVVVGMPWSLSGRRGRAAQGCPGRGAGPRYCGRRARRTYDERFSTVTAERALAEMDVRGPARRKVVDKVAAAVILQWLSSIARAAGRP